MNSLFIAAIVGFGFTIYFAFSFGFEIGYDRGNVDGRKAVRKQLEQVGR
jgi:hypothetical protein